jgi:hypothetical protein
MPVSVPPPSGAPDRSFARGHRALPRRSGGDARHPGRRQRCHSLWDGHSLCPGGDAAAAPPSAGGATTRLPSVGAKCWVAWTLAPATATPSGPPPASTTRRRSPPLPAFREVATQEVTPHAGFAPGGVGRLPRPVHPTRRRSRPARPRGGPKCRLDPNAGSCDATCYRRPITPAIDFIGSRCANGR